MVIERTKDEIIVRLSPTVNTDDLKDFLDYARFKEITSKFSVKQKDVDKLASNINKDWWQKNREMILKRV
jgi:maltodextrin utilization protein YvdJ